MSSDAGGNPAGAGSVPGLAHRRSPRSVAETVERLASAIQVAGAKLFIVIDHSGEAERVGETLRETKLLIFGNPAVGTSAMVSAPLLAIDLPLKVLVWADNEGSVWMSYLDGAWLAARHGLTATEAGPLAAPDKLTAQVAG
jgi:uncharacterized protein (DUF302 family)